MGVTEPKNHFMAIYISPDFWKRYCQIDFFRPK